MRLFKEYQVIHNIDFDRIGIYEIDLAVESGLDRREELFLQVGSSANTEAIDISDNAVKEGDGSGIREVTDDEAVTKECTIGLPYNYLIDDGGHVRGSFEVYIFTDTQLSWPRIQKLGGMDLDHRLKSESLSVAQLKLIAEVEAQLPDPNLQKSRMGESLPTELMTKVYLRQYTNKKMLKKSKLNSSSSSSSWIMFAVSY